jgi:hypothetical protein
MLKQLSIWQIATIILLILFLWQWNCRGGGCNAVQGRKDTIVQQIIHVDSGTKTAIAPQPIYITPGTIPQQVPIVIQVPGSNKTDTVWKKLDSLEVVKAYFQHRHYFLGDTSQYGTIGVNADLSQNAIEKWSIEKKLLIPETIKTIVQQAAKRGQLFGKIELYGNEKPAFLHGFGGGLGYRSKKDKGYEFKIATINGTVYYGIGFELPLTH